MKQTTANTDYYGTKKKNQKKIIEECNKNIPILKEIENKKNRK